MIGTPRERLELLWQPYDPDPEPYLIDVEVARTADGHCLARTPSHPALRGEGASLEEAAEDLREKVEREVGETVRIRRPSAGPRKKK